MSQHRGTRSRAKHGRTERAAPQRHPPAPGLEAFGRRGAEREGYVASDMGCPDCPGVLYVTEVGEHGWLSFQCRVGHAFSAQSLLELKEDRLDEALWSALEILEELLQLYRVFAARDGGQPGSDGCDESSRIARAVKHRRILHALILSAGPEPLRRAPTHEQGG